MGQNGGNVEQQVNSKGDVIMCHRFMIPTPLFANAELAGKPPVDISRMNFIPCIGEKCAIWDEIRLQCCDKTRAEAADRLATAIEAKFKSTGADVDILAGQ